MTPPDAADDRSVLVRTGDAARTFGQGATAVVAVHGATCEVRVGQSVVITGASGSGKSTLLHLLAGLDEPTQGHVTWPALGALSELRPSAVALVFQGPSLLPALDVIENVALPLLLAGVAAADAIKRAEGVLASLGLDGLAAKLPEDLSGGQAQRVAVARALAGRPRLIVADEPTGQLDHESAQHVIYALREAADDIGAGFVLSTHDPSIAQLFPVRWTMADGRLTTGEEPRTHVGDTCSA